MELDPADARRIAVRAQLLTADRPTDLVDTVRRLTMLQLDPTAAIAPSADLVAWSRLGSAYRPEHLTAALAERRLFELGAVVRPMSDLGLYLAVRPRPPEESGASAWVAANDAFRRDVLARLRDAGPLPSREIPDTAQVPWTSTGWTHEKNVTRMLEILAVRGEVAISGRVGRERLWDLPAALAALDEPFPARAALLSPFDRLVHDRVRAELLFGFEYVLEMYKPAARRRWGYFALPVLHGDRLVGKLDASADRKARVLRVHAVHEDVPWSSDVRDAVDAEIAALGDWLGVAVVRE